MLLANNKFLNARGDFHLFWNYDGPYGFLLGSLNIAQFEQPGYFHHPAIIPLMVGATSIKISHSIFGTDKDIENAVFDNPELYLRVFNLGLCLLGAVSVFILGYIVYKRTSKITAAIFLQLTPFTSEVIFRHNASVIAESAMMFCLFFLVAVSISYMYDRNSTAKKTNLYMTLFVISCGMVLATKISMLPIMIIPFLLFRTLRERIVFVLGSLIVFFGFLVMMSPSISTLGKFILQNVIRSGKYGSGEATFIDPGSASSRLIEIWTSFLFFDISFILVIIIAVLWLWKRYRMVISSNIYFRLLIGILIVDIAFIVLVVKQFETYYLLPAMLLSLVGILCFHQIALDIFPVLYKKYGRILLIAVMIFSLFFEVRKTSKAVEWFNGRKIESIKMDEYVQENHSKELIISSDFSSNTSTAFSNGLKYVGHKTSDYYSKINSRYPKFIYFQKFVKKLLYLEENPELKNELLSANTVVLQLDNKRDLQTVTEEISRTTGKTVENQTELYSNKNGEVVYRIFLK
jgi:hypothetical protein